MTRPECEPLKQAAEQAELMRVKLAGIVQSAQQAEQIAAGMRDLLQGLYEACEMGGGPGGSPPASADIEITRVVKRHNPEDSEDRDA